MIGPGGIVLWQDYRGPRKAKGVFRALNEPNAKLPPVRIKGMAPVACRRPENGDPPPARTPDRDSEP